MKITQVHDVDLIGRNFNGFDLQLQLNKRGIHCKQIVKKKDSDDDHVVEMKERTFVEQKLMFLENILSVNNLFPPYSDLIESHEAFHEADIVHYHMIHHYLISVFDMHKLMNKKRSVWTIHDPWIFTGHCVHPLECDKWKTGCIDCEKTDNYFKLETDKSNQMWELKHRFWRNLNVDIVVSSEFTKQYLQNSPITKDWKRIHVIPFGVDISTYLKFEKHAVKKKRELPSQKTVLGFRLDNNEIKGCQYIWKMLDLFENADEYILACVGNGNIPKKIRERFQVIEYGWTKNKDEVVEFHTICDIFLMPSLVESFGVMAIEAMAAECTVICFENTVLEEITGASECGMAVEYADGEAMFRAVQYLHGNKEELNRRGRLGRSIVKEKYNYNNYVDKHIQLYEEIIQRKD